ncbi:MAG TPA: hypothetical protein PK280_11635 [Planctomycetota bacterium]|nr:hypothetical protein [Planctomycetota bacterium]
MASPTPEDKPGDAPASPISPADSESIPRGLDKMTIDILKDIFAKGWACLVTDLERILQLRQQGRISENLWGRYVEAQVDLLMARGYEHLAERDKAAVLPLGHLRYDETDRRADVCFAVPCESGQPLYAMGEVKFIRDRKRNNEELLLTDIAKVCLGNQMQGYGFVVWLFAGEPHRFLPFDSRIADLCQWCRNNPRVPVLFKVNDVHVSLAGVQASIRVRPVTPSMPPNYEGYFLWQDETLGNDLPTTA